MRTGAAVALTVLIATTACSVEQSNSLDRGEEATEVVVEEAATVEAVDERAGDDVTAEPVVPETPTIESADTNETDAPLLLHLTVHAEGWTHAVDADFAHQRHLDALLELASVAARYGVSISFDVDTHLVDALAAHGTADVLDDLVSMGHEIGIHADAGGRGDPTFDELADELVRQRDALADLGVVTTNVSGICSRGPWVEAAIAAGFDSVTGMVEYCMTSLDPSLVPPDSRRSVAACTSPSGCHGPIGLPIEQRMLPWVAWSSADWIVQDTVDDAGAQVATTDGIVLIASEAASGLHCPQDTGCTVGGGGTEVVVGWVEAYLDAQAATGERGVLALTWSIGGVPTDGFAESLFEALAPYVEAGAADWATVPELTALA